MLRRFVTAQVLAVLTAWSGAVQAQAASPVNPARVVPLVKGVAEINALPLQVRRSLVVRPLTEALYVVLAEDMGGSFKYLSKAEVQGLGWQGDDEKTNALINMVKLLPRFQIRGSEGTFMIIAGGNYEASLILATPLWERLRKELKGDPVVGIPSRDLLFITGSDDKKNLADLRKTVDDFYKDASHPISRELFIVNAQGYRIFKEAP